MKFKSFIKEQNNKTCLDEEIQSLFETINISLDEEFDEFLSEGVHDKGIFKAVFLGGGPGSGKDFILSKTLDGHGLTEINSDKAFEYLMDKENLDMKMPEDEQEARNLIRQKAKTTTEIKQKLALMGRNGLIINGTGDDPEKIKRIKERLEYLGYDTSMILVNTADDVSKQRNIQRGERGGRTVPEEIRKAKWTAVQKARPKYAEMFGDNYKEFDNSYDSKNAPPEVVKQKEKEMLDLFKGVQKFVSKEPENSSSKFWIASELQKKDTFKPDTTKEIVPHPDSSAAKQARELGLTYYGFGRYGKDGKVTHRSINDKLVTVQGPQKQTQVPVGTSSGSGLPQTKIPPLQLQKLQKLQSQRKLPKITETFSEDLRKWFDPKHPEGGWKRINSKGEAIGPCAREPGEAKPKCMSNEKRAALSKKERAAAVAVKRKHDPNPERQGKPINVSNFGKGKLSEDFENVLSEAITVSITADTPEEVNKMFSNMFNKSVKQDEQYELSGTDAKEILSLGKKTSVSEIRHDSITFSNDDIKEIMEEDENHLKDNNGVVRKFALRAAAAKEAHQKNGTVIKHPKGYYLIKLDQEKKNAQISEESIFNEDGRRTTSIGYLSEHTSSTQRRTGKESLTESRGATTKETHKISLAEIRKRKTQKEINSTRSTGVSESTQINEIDKGIEPGLSMAGAGEGIGRDMGEKIKKKTGKITVVDETIGAGGEMATSMSDNEELKLKRKGIDLQTFKAKRPIG